MQLLTILNPRVKIATPRTLNGTLRTEAKPLDLSGSTSH